MVTQLRMRLAQFARLALLMLLVWGMHHYYQRRIRQELTDRFSRTSVLPALSAYPEGASLGMESDQGRWWVLDSSGATIGYVIQTAPESDSFLGFSGPTNLWLAFDYADRLKRIEILASQDTREHVALIERNRTFWEQWLGRTPLEIAEQKHWDSVSGATLTSRAIVQSVSRRLGSKIPVGQFSEPISLEQTIGLFPEASHIERDSHVPSLWHVLDGSRQEIGWMLRTSPAADHIVGYQGPTDTRIGISTTGEILGIQVAASFDNEPYVGYVRKDRWFQNVWKKHRWPEIASLNLQEAGVEGVSGATMTSMAIAESLVATAKQVETSLKSNESSNVGHADDASLFSRVQSWFQKRLNASDWGTLLFVSVVIGWVMRRGGGKRRWHLAILVGSIVFLGIVQGHLLSLALWGGWIQQGSVGEGSFLFVVLTLLAFLCASLFNRNIYCSHLCSYGAMQQLMPRNANRSPGTSRRDKTTGNTSDRNSSVVKLVVLQQNDLVPGEKGSGTTSAITPTSSSTSNWMNWRTWLRYLRPILLVVAWGILMFGVPQGWELELAHMEPFNAFVWEVVSYPSLIVALVGLLLTWRVPMGYCQHACMTGVLLDYLRPVRFRDRIRNQDLFVAWLAISTLALLWLT